MSDERDIREIRSLGLEPEDLDGHTIEDLADYLDSGRTPPDPSIEASPGCRQALDALERLRTLTQDHHAADTAAEAEADEGWVQGILAGIALDARAGRRIPIATKDSRADLGISEGAVRGLIRAAESAVPGVLIGRCHLDGDVREPHAPVRVRVEASVPYGEPIPGLADRLRMEISGRLSTHTELAIASIDITVHDVQRPPAVTEENQ